MIHLEETIALDVPLEDVFQWFASLDTHFTQWSPNHTFFHKVSGGLAVGDTIEFEELIMGVRYRIRGVIQTRTKTDTTFCIAFETLSGLAHIKFIGERTEQGCLFTHREEFGKPDTLFGRFFNWMLFRVIARKRANWPLIVSDMQKDNLYLKQILETGVYPV